MTTGIGTERKFTGWHMLGIIGAFFGVIIAVNITLAVLAATSWSGLIVKNSYVASQHYNEELAAARAQAALGWTSAAAHRDGTLFVDLRNGAGQTLAGLRVTAEVARPAHEGETRSVVLTPAAAGGYRADLPLAPGQWSVDMTATDAAGRHYRQVFRLFAKG